MAGHWSQILADVCTVLEVLATILAVAAFILAQFLPGIRCPRRHGRHHGARRHDRHRGGPGRPDTARRHRARVLDGRGGGRRSRSPASASGRARGRGAPGRSCPEAEAASKMALTSELITDVATDGPRLACVARFADFEGISTLEAAERLGITRAGPRPRRRAVSGSDEGHDEHRRVRRRRAGVRQAHEAGHSVHHPHLRSEPVHDGGEGAGRSDRRHYRLCRCHRPGRHHYERLVDWQLPGHAWTSPRCTTGIRTPSKYPPVRPPVADRRPRTGPHVRVPGRGSTRWLLVLPAGVAYRSGKVPRPAIRGVVDEVLHRVSAGVSRDSLTPFRIELERRLSEMAQQARSAGGVDLYLPIEYTHGVTITASFVVSQVTLPDPPAELPDAEQADTTQFVSYLTSGDGDASPVEIAARARPGRKAWQRPIRRSR